MIKLNIKKKSIEESLFLLALATYTFSTLLTISFYYIKVPTVTYNIVTVFCILLLVFKELIHARFTLRELFSLFISCFIFAIASKSSVNNAAYLLFIFSARNCNFKRALKIVGLSSAIGLAFVVVSSLAGIIENYEGYSDFRLRQFIGFAYALYAPAIMFNITAIVIYLYKSKIKWITIIILSLANIYIYSYSQSKLSFYFATMLIIFSILVKVFSIKSFPPKLLFCLNFSFIFFFLLSIVVEFNYSYRIKWMYSLDQVLENRLSLANASLFNYGIHLFKTDVGWTGFGIYLTGQRAFGQYIYVDNFYIFMLQLYGIVFSLILIFLLTRTLFECYKKGDFMLSFILSIYAIHGVIDNLIFTPYYNAFLLAIGVYAFQRRSSEQKINKKFNRSI